MTTAEAFKLVAEELAEAERLHKPMTSPHEGFALILEELDEVWDEVRCNNNKLAKEEAVQVAAMAIRFMKDIT